MIYLAWKILLTEPLKTTWKRFLKNMRTRYPAGRSPPETKLNRSTMYSVFWPQPAIIENIVVSHVEDASGYYIILNDKSSGKCPQPVFHKPLLNHFHEACLGTSGGDCTITRPPLRRFLT